MNARRHLSAASISVFVSFFVFGAPDRVIFEFANHEPAVYFKQDVAAGEITRLDRDIQNTNDLHSSANNDVNNSKEENNSQTNQLWRSSLLGKYCKENIIKW